MFATCFGGPYGDVVLEVPAGETRIVLPLVPPGQQSLSSAMAVYQLAGNRLLYLGTADGPAGEADDPIVVGGQR